MVGPVRASKNYSRFLARWFVPGRPFPEARHWLVLVLMLVLVLLLVLVLALLS